MVTFSYGNDFKIGTERYDETGGNLGSLNGSTKSGDGGYCFDGAQHVVIRGGWAEKVVNEVCPQC